MFPPINLAGGAGGLSLDTSSTATSGPIGGGQFSFGGLNVGPNGKAIQWAWPLVAVAALGVVAFFIWRR